MELNRYLIVLVGLTLLLGYTFSVVTTPGDVACTNRTGCTNVTCPATKFELPHCIKSKCTCFTNQTVGEVCATTIECKRSTVCLNKTKCLHPTRSLVLDDHDDDTEGFPYNFLRIRDDSNPAGKCIDQINPKYNNITTKNCTMDSECKQSCKNGTYRHCDCRQCLCF